VKPSGYRQGLGDVQEVTRGSGEPVEAGHEEDVASAQCRQKLVELRPIAPGTAYSSPGRYGDSLRRGARQLARPGSARPSTRVRSREEPRVCLNGFRT